MTPYCELLWISNDFIYNTLDDKFLLIKFEISDFARSSLDELFNIYFTSNTPVFRGFNDIFVDRVDLFISLFHFVGKELLGY